MGKTKAATATKKSPLKISTSLFQKRKNKPPSSSSDSSSEDSSVPSPSGTKKKGKVVPKANAKLKIPVKTKVGAQKEKESKKRVVGKKIVGKKGAEEKGGTKPKATKKVVAKTKKDKDKPTVKPKRTIRARSPSSSTSDTSSSSDESSSSSSRSPSPANRRASASSSPKQSKSPAPKKSPGKKVLSKNTSGEKKGARAKAKEKVTKKVGAGYAKGSPKKTGASGKPGRKPTKPKAKLKRMASLNAKAMLEATYSFEAGEKRRSPAKSEVLAVASEPAADAAPDFKPLTLLFSGDSDFPSTKETAKSGERKRKSTKSESPVRRESTGSNGTKGDTCEVTEGFKKEKEKSKSPAPRKKSKVTSSVSTSTSPFDSGEEMKSVQHPLGYEHHPGMIGGIHQRNFTLSAPFPQHPSSQNVHGDDHSNHFHPQHHHQGSVKGRGGSLSREKSKATTPNPFGSTVYQPAGPLIEPHKTSSVPAGLLPDTVRIPSDLKVTYQSRPPPTSSLGGGQHRNSSGDQKKSEGRSSSKSSSSTSTSISTSRSSSQNKILHQPYKSTSTTSTATSSTKQSSTTFIHSPVPVNSTFGTSSGMGAGNGGALCGTGTGTMTQSAALTSHINPSSAIISPGAPAGGGAPSSLYFGYGHQSGPFAPSKFPIVPPDSFRTPSPFGSPYLYPQSAPATPSNYFMSPSFYGSPGVGAPSSGLQARAMFHHPASSVTGAPPFYQQPPPSSHPVSNYYVTAPPVGPPPSLHSVQPSTAPGHAGPHSHPNPSSQPACPCPTDSSLRNNNFTSSSSSSTTNSTISSNKANRSLLRKLPPLLPATNDTLPASAAQAVASNKATPGIKVKKSTQPKQVSGISAVTQPKSTVRLNSTTGNVRLNDKVLKLNSSTTISPIPPPATQLENAKTFTDQYSLPDDITITPIIMKSGQRHGLVAGNGTLLPKPEKKKDIVHVIDPRSGESTTIAKHISINNIYRTNCILSNVSSVKPNNAGNVGKISPSLDVIVLNSKQVSAKVKGHEQGRNKNFTLLNAERPQLKSHQQQNSTGKSLLINSLNTNLVQPLHQAQTLNPKNENKNKPIRRKGLTLNECIDGLQRKKMRILADTNVTITNVTPGSVPTNSTDHHRLLSISITPDNHEEHDRFGNNLYKETNTQGPNLNPKNEVKHKLKLTKGGGLTNRQHNLQQKKVTESDFSTKLLDCNDAVAAVSALLIPASSTSQSPPHSSVAPMTGPTGLKKRQGDKKPLKIKLLGASSAGSVSTRSTTTPKLRSRGNLLRDAVHSKTGGGRGKTGFPIRAKDGIVSNSVSYADVPHRNGSSTLTTSNNHVILRIPKAGERQGKVAVSSSGNMTVTAMKKRAIVKPLSPAAINGAIQTLAFSNKRLPIHTHPRWSNGWRFEGKSFEAKVYIKNDDNPVLRRCYPTMRHDGGDIIRARDCVLLKSGPRKTDLPFVAKVAALFENPADGEMMFSLLWYYRPEHTDIGRNKEDMLDEIFASKHRDSNSVATIEDKCYVFTFNEYCRYKKRLKQLLEGIPEATPIVPLSKSTSETRVPVTNMAVEVANSVWNGISTTLSALSPDKAPNANSVESVASTLLIPAPVIKLTEPKSGSLGTKNHSSNGKIPAEVVFFCRRVYDYRQKRMLKNPS